MKERLLGELIGLARATEGNEHLITPSVTAVVTECLASAGTLEMLQKIEAEKRSMVPNCFSCAAPCGRNNAFDLCLLEKEEPEARRLKQQLLSGLQSLAAKAPKEAESVYYQALIAVGIEGIDLQILESLLAKIQKLS